MTEWLQDFFLMSLQGTVLIAALLVLRKIFAARMSPAVLYALWLIPAARLLIPGSMESIFSFQNLISPSVEQQTAAVMQQNALSVQMPAQPAQTLPVQTTDAVQPAAAAPAVFLEVGAVLLMIWLIGVLGVLLFAAWKNFTFVRRAKQGAVRVEVDCRLPVYLSENISSPCLCGLFHPVILVSDATLQSDAYLDLALRHELGHYRAGDRFWALLRLLCCALHWFNPLVWIAAKASVQDCEKACDWRVLKGAGQSEREAYGALLLFYLKQPPARYSLLCTSSPMGGGKRSLRDRIALIGKKPTTKKAAVVALAACVALTCLVACTGRFNGGEAVQKPHTEIYQKLARAADKTEFVAYGMENDVVLTISGPTLARYLGSAQWTALDQEPAVEDDPLVQYWFLGDESNSFAVVQSGEDGSYYAHVSLQGEDDADSMDAWYMISDQEAGYAWAMSQLSGDSTLRSALPNGGAFALVCAGPALGSEWHYLFYGEDESAYAPVYGNLDALYPRVAEQFYFVNKNLGFVSFRYEVINDLQPPHLYRTEDGGKTWARVELPMMGVTTDNGYGGIHVTEIAFDYAEDKAEEKNGRITVGMTYGEQDLSCMFTTNDGGRTWYAVTSGGPDQRADAAASIALYDANGDGMLQTMEFPVPTGETFGLSGDDAVLYSAAAQATLQGIGGLSQDTMLILTSLTVLGEYDSVGGEKNYVCIRRRHFYYDLGEDVRNTPYNTGTATNLACITIAADGSLVDIQETYDGADNTGRIRELCGPLTDLADALINETEVPGESRTLAPQRAEDLAAQYLAYYFPELCSLPKA